MAQAEISYFGVVQNHKWSWDEVHQVRLVTDRGADKQQRLRLLSASGHDRTIVTNVGRLYLNPELDRLCATINQQAVAPDPGPSKQSTRLRLLGMVGLGLVVLAVTTFAVGMFTSVNEEPLDAAEVPAGRPYSYYVRDDGSVTGAYIECPSLASHLTGTEDRLCTGSFSTQSVVVAVTLFIDFALIAGLTVLSTRFLRLTKERWMARVSSAVGER